MAGVPKYLYAVRNITENRLITKSTGGFIYKRRGDAVRAVTTLLCQAWPRDKYELVRFSVVPVPDLSHRISGRKYCYTDGEFSSKIYLRRPSGNVSCRVFELVESPET